MKNYVTISSDDGMYVVSSNRVSSNDTSNVRPSVDANAAQLINEPEYSAGGDHPVATVEDEFTHNSEEPIVLDAEPVAFDDQISDYRDESVIPDVQQKAKGVAQMAAGAAVAAAGVPMLILPGPGVAALAGGVALASKGQRNYSGREATPVEKKLDETASKMVDVAKEQAEATAKKIEHEAPIVAEKVAWKVGNIAGDVVNAASKAVPAAIDSLEKKSPEAMEAVRKTGYVAKGVARKATIAGVTALDKAPDFMRKVTHAFDGVIASGKAGFESEKNKSDNPYRS